MTPNSQKMFMIPMRSRDDDAFYMRRIDFSGNIVEESIGDLNHPNFTRLVSDGWLRMPTMIDYVACVNCYFPIARKSAICHIITAPKHPYIHTGYCMPIGNVTAIIAELSPIHWKNKVKCHNCRITLSIQALTNYNTPADEYTNDRRCVIFDASCVYFTRKE